MNSTVGPSFKGFFFIPPLNKVLVGQQCTELTGKAKKTLFSSYIGTIVHVLKKKKKKKKGKCQNADIGLYQLYPNGYLVCIWDELNFSAHFCYYSWIPLHFLMIFISSTTLLILFMGFIVLFNLFFNIFFYTFS